MKNIRSHWFLVSVLLLLAASAGARSQEIEYSVLPGQSLMPKFTANITEHGLSVAKFFEKDHYWVGLGNSFPLVRFFYGVLKADVVLGGTVFTQLDHKPGSFRVINTDFYADLLCTVTWDDVTFVQVGAGHTSQHLNDDALEILGYSHSINYVRDYYRFSVLRAVEFLRGYVYCSTLYHHTFKIPTGGNPLWLFEFGADVAHTPLTPWMTAYGAFDIKLRDELKYASTQSYQIGVRVHGDSPHILRLAITHRAGYEERGQFFNTTITAWTLGVYFDF